MADSVLASSAEIASVTVSKSFFNTINVNIKKKIPAALWCLDESCANIDQDGLAFSRATSTQGSLVVFQDGEKPSVGTSLLPTSEFAQLFIFTNDLFSRGIVPESVAIHLDGTDDISVGTSTTIVVDSTKDMSPSLANLDKILSDKMSGITAATITSFSLSICVFPTECFISKV